MSNKIVLAFSGGLDTTFCIKYLTEELGLEVHSIYADTGGLTDVEKEKLATRARYCGVTSHHCMDIQADYYQKGIKYLLYGNILKHNTYPLSVSSERTFQAMAVVEYATEIGAEMLAHGCTGAGNDQIRFDLIFNVLAPNMKIISPVRDLNLPREKEIEYLKDKGINLDFSDATYSYNEGIWGSSIGGKETLQSSKFIPECAWPSEPICTNPIERDIEVEFNKGEVVALNGDYLSPLQLINKLNLLGNEFGIGRGLHLGDTITGLKGRIAFEAPAALMLIKAHELLEKHVLSKQQLQIKEQLCTTYGNLIHEGFYLDNAVRDLEKYLESTQSHVSGAVKLKLIPHTFELIGISSIYDLHHKDFGEYGEESKLWNANDIKGFIKLYSIPIQLQHLVNNAKG